MLFIEEVVIGNPRNKHEKFNDQNVLLNHPIPHKIKKIKVQYNNDHVVGIKLWYSVGNGKEVKGESSLKFKPIKRLFTSMTKEVFTIHDDDYLKSIHGFFGNEINQIGFETYKGHKATFGKPKGTHFHHHVQGHTFTAARGTFEKFLDFIAFRVVRLPEIFISKNVQNFSYHFYRIQQLK